MAFSGPDKNKYRFGKEILSKARTLGQTEWVKDSEGKSHAPSNMKWIGNVGKAGTIYRDKPSKDGKRVYHNVIGDWDDLSDRTKAAVEGKLSSPKFKGKNVSLYVEKGVYDAHKPDITTKATKK